MNHLGEQRLLEISRGSQPNTPESDHLARCPECKGSLHSETRLSHALVSLPRAHPRLDFVDMTVARFVRRRARRRLRTFMVSSAALLFGCGVLLVAAPFACLAALSATVHVLVVAATIAAPIWRAAAHLGESLPWLWAPLMGALWASLALCSLALCRLSFSVVMAK